MLLLEGIMNLLVELYVGQLFNCFFDKKLKSVACAQKAQLVNSCCFILLFARISTPTVDRRYSIETLFQVEGVICYIHNVRVIILVRSKFSHRNLTNKILFRHMYMIAKKSSTIINRGV